MKIAIYTGTFESEQTRVTVHESQGTIYATLEVRDRPVPPAMQSTAQRSLVEACKQHTKKARSEQQPAQSSQSEPARALVLPSTSTGQSQAPRAEQPEPEPPTDQQPEGRRFVTRIAAEPTEPTEPTDTSATAKPEQPTSRTNESALLGATQARPRVPAQRPSRIRREYIDA